MLQSLALKSYLPLVVAFFTHLIHMSLSCILSSVSFIFYILIWQFLFIIIVNIFRAGEMACQLRAHTIAEDLSLVSSTHSEAHNCL